MCRASSVALTWKVSLVAGTCHSVSVVKLWSGAPTPPPVMDSAEFYFGQVLPGSAGSGAILDDGTGFAQNRDGGLDYGWDCEVRFLTEILDNFRRFVDGIWPF